MTLPIIMRLLASLRLVDLLNDLKCLAEDLELLLWRSRVALEVKQVPRNSGLKLVQYFTNLDKKLIY